MGMMDEDYNINDEDYDVDYAEPANDSFPSSIEELIDLLDEEDVDWVDWMDDSIGRENEGLLDQLENDIIEGNLVEMLEEIDDLSMSSLSSSIEEMEEAMLESFTSNLLASPIED